MTPDQIKGLLEPWWVAIMIGWGILTKYFPPLARIPNSSIAWVNLVAFIAAKFAVPDAHASGLSALSSSVGALAGGFANSGVAAVIYEAFLRGPLERWLKLKKA